jgi:DNA-binding NtrC family response regulator
LHCRTTDPSVAGCGEPKPAAACLQIMSSDQPVSSSRAAVLVVDDDADVREVAVEFLTAIGITVFDAETGAGALALLDRHPEIGVLFSDVRMAGGMNGVELATEARHRRPDLQVVMTSGHVGGGGVIPDLEFLPKPYHLRDLARKIIAKLTVP